ncbi:MAG: hypothetical protein GF320_04935 [Armatimonadia bacterium]|nr:hypothetical protein [Armatimonadia bacterium]
MSTEAGLASALPVPPSQRFLTDAADTIQTVIDGPEPFLAEHAMYTSSVIGTLETPDGPVPTSLNATMWPVAWRAVDGHGEEVALEGRAGVVFGGDSVGALGQIEPAQDPRTAMRLVASTVVRWPDGMYGMGRASLDTTDAGALRWSHLPLDPLDNRGGVADPALAASWPMTIKGWTDGRWWAVIVTTRWPPQIRHPLPPDGEMPVERAPGEPSRGAALRAAVPLAPTLVELSEIDALADVLREGAKLWLSDAWAAFGDLDLRAPGILGSPNQWEQTALVSPPPSVSGVLARSDLPPSLGFHLLDGESVGVYSLPEAPGFWYGGAPAVLQWAASGRAVALTQVVPTGQFGDDADPVPPQMARDLIRDTLPRLLGARGRRLCLVPLDVEPVAGTPWALFTPDPDHRIGWDGETRVGDTDWGNCRIYVHPSILHIVFDLPDEDEG